MAQAQEMVNQTRMLDDLGDLQIWTLGEEWLPRFNAHIQKIYQDRDTAYAWGPGEFDQILEENRVYLPHTKLCAVMTPGGEIVGTWGLILKRLGSNEFQLPIEKKFGVDLEEVNRTLGTHGRWFFNGFRTAIDKDKLEAMGYSRSKSVRIFDLLLRGLTQDFTEGNDMYVGVAEMEETVLRYHRLIGIPWVTLGEPREYWGSAKYPCAFSLPEYETNMKERHYDRYKLIYRISD